MTVAGQAAVVELGRARLAITVLTPRVIRIGWSASGTWPDRRPWAVTAADETFATCAVERRDEAGTARLATRDLSVTITADGQVIVRTADGREIARTIDVPSFDAEANRTRWPIRMPPDRRYYGFGERTGLLEKRGRCFTCWTTDEWEHQGATTDATYIAVPFHLGLDPGGLAHGVYLDTTRRSSFDLTAIADERLVLEAAADTLDWYVLLGPSPAEVVEAFTALVGRASLPPRWAFGYHQARFSYETADEMRSTARALREHRIPADVVHFDIHHYDRFRPFTWDRDRFPDPAGLIAARSRLVARAGGDGWRVDVEREGTFDPGPRTVQIVAGAPPARRQGS